MTQLTAEPQAHVRAWSPVWAFARRNVRARWNLQSVVIYVVYPAAFIAGFLVLFGALFESRGLDYAQFLPPAIAAQWMFTVANGAGAGIAADAATGLYQRCRLLPIPRAAYLVGRLLSDLLWAAGAVAVILAIGAVAGFRLSAGWLDAVLFLGVVLAFEVVLALGAVAFGLWRRDEADTASTLDMIHLLLILSSTAYVPAEAFPSWLEPVVAHSPVSAVIEALRALASGDGTAAPELGTALAWLAAGALVLGGAALAAGRRR